MVNKKHAFLILTILLPFLANAQKTNWQNLDLKADSTFGISTEKAYTELLQGKKATKVIVAVIDAGVDTSHEDLKSVLWLNPKKNKIKDLHGWSFIGSAKGNVHYDNLELTRQVRQQQSKFEGKDSTVDLAGYQTYQKEKAELSKKLKEDREIIRNITGFEQVLDGMVKKIGKDDPGLADFEAFQPKEPGEEQVRKVMLEQKEDYSVFKAEQLDGAIQHYQEETDYQLNVNYDPRSIIGDDYFNSRQKNYGSPDVMGPDATHGTHVAGIIAAVRDNNRGMKGIADHVQIMAVRMVPDGDERDKDVANAIRYAADHGAKVINMSFGKPYSQDKKAVDEAVKYALSKDVLLVQAAGNSNENIDTVANYPNRNYLDGGQAGAWLVVGASGWKDDETLKAPFSNYGKTAVDVFAPGEQIYSCIPGSKYAAFDGTSMAGPVVVGLVALIREYYPRLTAVQVKDIIIRSVITRNVLNEKCVTGGVVNAYEALLLAAKEDAI